uniref:Uncharacterized protein n=1 Tax=Acrobeloides nanus TaxID=290746 RepID=A0A914BY69_9BILA
MVNMGMVVIRMEVTVIVMGMVMGMAMEDMAMDFMEIPSVMEDMEVQDLIQELYEALWPVDKLAPKSVAY